MEMSMCNDRENLLRKVKSQTPYSPYLAKMASNPDPKIRGAVARIIDIGSAAFEPLLRDPDRNVRTTAVYRLPSGSPYAAVAAKDSDPWLRLQAVRLLRRNDVLIFDLIEDENEKVRKEALKVLSVWTAS